MFCIINSFLGFYFDKFQLKTLKLSIQFHTLKNLLTQSPHSIMLHTLETLLTTSIVPTCIQLSNRLLIYNKIIFYYVYPSIYTSCSVVLVQRFFYFIQMLTRLIGQMMYYVLAVGILREYMLLFHIG